MRQILEGKLGTAKRLIGKHEHGPARPGSRSGVSVAFCKSRKTYIRLGDAFQDGKEFTHIEQAQSRTWTG